MPTAGLPAWPTSSSSLAYRPGAGTAVRRRGDAAVPVVAVLLGMLVAGSAQAQQRVAVLQFSGMVSEQTRQSLVQAVHDAAQEAVIGRPIQVTMGPGPALNCNGDVTCSAAQARPLNVGFAVDAQVTAKGNDVTVKLMLVEVASEQLVDSVTVQGQDETTLAADLAPATRRLMERVSATPTPSTAPSSAPAQAAPAPVEAPVPPVKKAISKLLTALVIGGALMSGFGTLMCVAMGTILLVAIIPIPTLNNASLSLNEVRASAQQMVLLGAGGGGFLLLAAALGAVTVGLGVAGTALQASGWWSDEVAGPLSWLLRSMRRLVNK